MDILTKQQQKLVEDNLNLAYTYVHKYNYKYGFDFEDAVSFAFIGLVKAASSFDSYRNVKFSTYAFVCISNEFRMEGRRINKYNKLNITQSLQDTISLEDDSIVLEDIIPSFRDYFEDFEFIEQLKYAYEQLTEKEKQVISYFFYTDWNQGKIAKACNISQSCVSRISSKFKKLIRS